MFEGGVKNASLQPLIKYKPSLRPTYTENFRNIRRLFKSDGSESHLSCIASVYMKSEDALAIGKASGFACVMTKRELHAMRRQGLAFLGRLAGGGEQT